MRSIPLSLIAITWALAMPVGAQNCSNTTMGLTPLTDLGSNTYQGFEGGLYRGGSNRLPPAHSAAGLTAAASVQPLDTLGNPTANGKIVVMSVGMSNTTDEFSTWVPISDADPNRNPAVAVVDCAQSGQDAAIIANPNANYWRVVQQRLAAAGVTAAQVQVAWLKVAVANPSGGFPAHALQLQNFEVQICQNLRAKFPNLKICYVSSRIYAGYAIVPLNPEPYAYESGFAARWLLDQQIGGDPALNWNPNLGAVRSPWLAWGPYMWADGVVPRSDGLIWQCTDFQPDGTHPASSGRQKVAAMLDQHFNSDPTAVLWYRRGTPAASITRFGQGCAGGNGALVESWNSTPYLGNSTFALGLQNGRPNSAAVLFWSPGRAAISIEGCTLQVDLTLPNLVQSLTTNSAGHTFQRLPIPLDQSLFGAILDTQWLVLDPAAPGLRGLLGGAAMSTGVELRLGTL